MSRFDMRHFVTVPSKAFNMGISQAKILVDYSKGITTDYLEYILSGLNELHDSMSHQISHKLLDHFSAYLKGYMEKNAENMNIHNFANVPLAALVMCLHVECVLDDPENKIVFTGLCTHNYNSERCYKTITDTIKMIDINIMPDFDTLLPQYYVDLCGTINTHYIVLPFISKSGAFGYNTFLYLITEKIAPVGICINKNTNLHAGMINQPLSVFAHDYQHYVNRYANITGDLHSCYCQTYQHILFTFKARKLKENYRLLFYLFFLINEIAYVPSNFDNKKSINNAKYLPQKVMECKPSIIEKITNRCPLYDSTIFSELESSLEREQIWQIYALEFADFLDVFRRSLKYDQYPEDWRHTGAYVQYCLFDMHDLMVNIV